MSKSKNDEGDKSSQSPSLDNLKNELHEQISKKKYLLVLDDVQNNQSENWEKGLFRPNFELLVSKLGMIDIYAPT